MKSSVALIPCENYDKPHVEAAIADLLAHLGGISAFVKPGQKVLIKPNLLMRRTPEHATTTHPAVVEAVVREVQRVGGKPFIAESPGGPYSEILLKRVYEGTGMTEVSKHTDVELNLRIGTTTMDVPDGIQLKRFDVLEVLPEADVLISIGKLKTHGLTTMTGAVKNLYGLVPGTVKVDYHARFPDRMDFADMLVDLCEGAKPALAIIDGIDGMEGEGPSGGKPRHIGVLIGSANAHAADAVAAQVIGLSTRDVSTLRLAQERGLLAEMEVLGADVEKVSIRDYDIPMIPPQGKSGIEVLASRVKRLRPKPVFPHTQCDGCGVCVRSCPVHAIEMNAQHRPEVVLSKCIRCFCCQELCPRNDVQIKRHWIMRVLR